MDPCFKSEVLDVGRRGREQAEEQKVVLFPATMLSRQCLTTSPKTPQVGISKEENHDQQYQNETDCIIAEAQRDAIKLFLQHMLSPLLNHVPAHLKNVDHFLNKLRETPIQTTRGLAMGSRVATLLAIVFMDRLERRILSSGLLFYGRYIDDIFVLPSPNSTTSNLHEAEFSASNITLTMRILNRQVSFRS
ncbi:hypothetical protein OSTOST_03262 [Ostertagia ostertagi]